MPRSWRPVALTLSLALAVMGSLAAPAASADVAWPPSTGLLVGEVVTGGVSGSDEYVEIFNPASCELDLGGYYAKIYTADSGQLIWSRGFSSYFGEWRTTGPAGKGVLRTYHESVLAPLPKAPVEFALELRDADGVLQEFFRTARCRKVFHM